MGRVLTVLTLTVASLFAGAGVASAEDFVLYKPTALNGRACTLAEYWAAGAIPGIDTCVVENLRGGSF